MKQIVARIKQIPILLLINNQELRHHMSQVLVEETVADSQILTNLTYAACGLFFLLAVKKYFSGGKCTVRRDLTGSIAVITGGNTGIGRQTAKILAEEGCQIIFGARDTKKNEEAKKYLQKTSKAKIKCFQLDLADKQSIENFAKNVQTTLNGRPINFLINNAGIMALKNRQITKQGFQMQMGVNHLGHFYLTYLLWPQLKAAGNPRIVNVSSLSHKQRFPQSRIDFNDINFQNNYGRYIAYSRSKKANIIFTSELQRKMDESNIAGISVSLHPGVVRTQLDRNFVHTFLRPVFFVLGGGIFMKSPEQGAQTTLYTIFERQQKLKKGGYYADCKQSPILSDQCRDIQAGKQFWKLSEDLWKIKFNL